MSSWSNARYWTATSIEEKLNDFLNILTATLTKTIPRKIFKRIYKYPPWWDENLTILRSKCRKLAKNKTPTGRDLWRGQMLSLLKDHKVKSYLVEKYVDDVEAVCENMQLGTRWTGDELVVTPESELEDREAGRNKDEVTMEAWGLMASSILPSLNFTVDYCSRNKDGSVPMLDFRLWKESQ